MEADALALCGHTAATEASLGRQGYAFSGVEVVIRCDKPLSRDTHIL